jgi:hypothetical protein
VEIGDTGSGVGAFAEWTLTPTAAGAMTIDPGIGAGRPT